LSAARPRTREPRRAEPREPCKAGPHAGPRSPVPRAPEPRAPDSDAARRLIEDAATLGVALAAGDGARLNTLLDELARWNRRYNLTGIRTREAMLTHHVLDSLAVSTHLVGKRVADVGTGAGFPGLPLALCNPDRHFTLIDSTAKKIRFVSHAAQLLGLTNVTALQARAETLRVDAPFDTVVARAFAPLPQLLGTVAHLCGPQSRVLAMKGRWPQAELERVPLPWRIVDSRELAIPRLVAARCLIVLALGQP
jgi:16S rRNA (guanine527-N7)-methyltransferase